MTSWELGRQRPKDVVMFVFFGCGYFLLGELVVVREPYGLAAGRMATEVGITPRGAPSVEVASAHTELGTATCLLGN